MFREIYPTAATTRPERLADMPDWPLFRMTIVDALRPYEGALEAIAEALNTVGTREAR